LHTKPEGNRALGRPMSRRSIILQRILRKEGVKMWTGFIWGYCGHGNEISGSITSAISSPKDSAA
jgi:hypothetical protein